MSLEWYGVGIINPILMFGYVKKSVTVIEPSFLWYTRIIFVME